MQHTSETARTKLLGPRRRSRATRHGEAVVQRDRAADGAFYYSVRTTGVYCRPSCAARLARREHVRFHATREEAEQAGFRPCKRCRPTEPALAEQYAAVVAKACHLIEAAEDMLNLEALAATAGMSRFHFHRIFKTLTGVTPKAYAAAHRAQRVRDELSRTDTVTEAIYGAGFHSNGRFYATSSEVLGMTPTNSAPAAMGHPFASPSAQCSLGSILVAATDKGVCAIMLGDDPEALVRDLQDRFPKAQLLGGDANFEHVVARVVGFVEAPALGLDLPLDVQGTALFSSASGKPCGRSHLAPRRATRKSLSVLGHRRYALWPRPVPQTPSPSPFPAIVSCARTAPWPVIAGASSASVLCSSARLSHDRRPCLQRWWVRARLSRARYRTRLAAHHRRPRHARLRSGGRGASLSRV